MLAPIRPQVTKQRRKVEPGAATDEDRHALLLVDTPGIAGASRLRDFVPVLPPFFGRTPDDDGHLPVPVARPPIVEVAVPADRVGEAELRPEQRDGARAAVVVA